MLSAEELHELVLAPYEARNGCEVLSSLVLDEITKNSIAIWIIAARVWFADSDRTFARIVVAMKAARGGVWSLRMSPAECRRVVPALEAALRETDRWRAEARTEA